MSRVLVISGGGSKGAYAVGVLQQIKVLFPAMGFEAIVGTSTGALIAPFAAIEAYDKLEQLYTAQTTDKIITWHRLGDRLNQPSIYTIEPLWQLIQKNITDELYRKIIQTGKKLYIVTVCLQTAEIVVFTTNKGARPSEQYRLQQIQDAAHLRHAVLASASQPVFMTPVKVNKDYLQGPEKEYQFVDGGVREYAGIQIAFEQGATEILAVLLSPRRQEASRENFGELFPILQRTVSTFLLDVEKNDTAITAVYAAAQRYLQAVKQNMRAAGISQAAIDRYFNVAGADGFLTAAQPVKIYQIRPDTPLGGGPGGLSFDPAEMRRMLNQGRGDAQAFFSNLPPEDPT